MASNFPEDLDVFINPTSNDPITNPPHSEQHANANDAIAAIQTKLGIDGSLDTTSVDYRLSTLEAQDPFDSTQYHKKLETSSNGSILKTIYSDKLLGLSPSSTYQNINTAGSSETLPSSSSHFGEYLLAIRSATGFRKSIIGWIYDDSTVSYHEYGIIEMGSAISGLAVRVVLSSSNIRLQVRAYEDIAVQADGTSFAIDIP